MDHNDPRAIIVGLRMKSVDVITAYEDGTSEKDDFELLDRAGKSAEFFLHMTMIF